MRIKSQRWYPRNLWTYCLLKSLIHLVTNKKNCPLPTWGNSVDGYSEMFGSYQRITPRTTNLALLPKTSVMVIILKTYQINARCRLRFFFLHYKDPKISLLVYATCLKSFHTVKQQVLEGNLFVCSRLATLWKNVLNLRMAVLDKHVDLCWWKYTQLFMAYTSKSRFQTAPVTY